MYASRVLTSWKDVANYVGKGVRTVQRWEHTLGLPVRRPTTDHSKATLIVDSNELEAWLRATFRSRKIDEVKLDWDLIKRSNQLIAESGPIRDEHSRLVEESHRVRMELEGLRLSPRNSSAAR
jgi:hypothetical protein